MTHEILILGKGYIGSRLQQELNCEISGARIYCLKDAETIIEKFNPKIIINCIGHVGRNVDACERDLDKVLMANTFVPILLAELALRKKIKLVHISSGCIYHFDYLKDNPIDEEKTPDFFDLFYSRTKIYPEQVLRLLSKIYPILILRIRIPLDNQPHPRNLLTKLISYKKVIELANSVTYIPDFVMALKHLLKINATGVYNVVNKGALDYTILLEEYSKYVPNFKYEVVEFKKLHLVRTNLILSTKKLEKSGFKVRNIKDVLKECVKGYLQYEKK